MNIGVSAACIGYKWNKDPVNAPVNQLATHGDWEHCLEEGIGKTARARTKELLCVIRNLNLPGTAPNTAPRAAAAPAAESGGKKRKADASPTTTQSPGGRKTFDYTNEYRELKNHLACATHKGENCFVSPADGHHHRVDRYLTTLWAKEIVCQFFFARICLT
ncbi:hypothetical protein R3P38DRAFT_2772299 [Favolaschia claudopus]|uniref:Uncharacterized protein n=1 Tax=Favolaschia claudopus TaxID=2862362 RepID=A0AAW0C6I6_9AGAR